MTTHSPPKRPTSMLQNSPMARATSIQSRPASARSILPPSSLQGVCSVRQKQLKGHVAKVPTSNSKASYKELQFKASSTKSAVDGNAATIGPASKSIPSRTIPASKPNATTIPSRPVSRATRRPLTPCGTYKGATARETVSQKKKLSRQNLGPENWTPITAKKITTCTPPPRLKLHRQKRASILPSQDGLSLFSPTKIPQNEIYEDIFYSSKSISQSSACQAPSKLVSHKTPTIKTFSKNESPELARELRKTRSAASLPSRHLEVRSRTASKTVSWDPSVVFIGPKLIFNSGNLHQKETEGAQANGTDEQAPAHRYDIKDCIETIKHWENADRSRLANLIEALKELGLKSQDKTQENMDAKSVESDDEEVIITTVKSRNPRVPDFRGSPTLEAREKPGKVEESKRFPQIKFDLEQSSECDSNKENIPDLPFEPQLKPQDSGICQVKKRTVVILDDYSCPGREVKSFDSWYGEMQLREFKRKYPLTGTRAGAVGSSAKNSAKTFRTPEVIKRAPSDHKAASKDLKIDTGGKKNVSVIENTGVRRIEGKRNIPITYGRADCNSRSFNLRPRRREKQPMTDPAARINAAIIQQRLEVLLLNEKERKAFEGMPEPLTVLPCVNTGSATLGIWSWNSNQFSGGLKCEAEPVWVPSERLRLKS